MVPFSQVDRLRKVAGKETWLIRAGVTVPLKVWSSGPDEEAVLRVPTYPCPVTPNTAPLPEAAPELWAAGAILRHCERSPPLALSALTPLAWTHTLLSSGD